MNTSKGKLIVIEGTDGSGKETQSVALRERLQRDGVACGYFSFPRYDTPTGQIIKMYLGKSPFNQEFGHANSVPPLIASTWYALDRQAAKGEINGLLDRGIHVVCNRYVESNLAHQGGKIRDSRQRAELISKIEKMEHDTLKVPRTDLVVFLYAPFEVTKKNRENRGGEKDGHEEDPEHMINAENTYLELADRFRWNKLKCSLDGQTMRSREDIGNEVYEIVSKLLQNS